MKVKLAVAALIAVTVLLGVGLGSYLYLAQNFASELRDGLVSACEDNGNPLRHGLREDKEEELASAEDPDPEVLMALHISRAQAIKLAQPRIAKLKRDVNSRYAPVDCAAQYPR
jgi:hypothetical protein